MDKYINDRVFLEDIPGLCVSIRKGEYSLQKAYGYRSYTDRIALDVDDIFHCTSISKLVTARAAESFDTGAHISEVLPWLDIDERITAKMLLSHTSGLGDTDGYGWVRHHSDDSALRRYLEGTDLKMLSEPGKRFIYSSLGYDILGAVVAELSGMSFEEYADGIFERAGMRNASFNTALRKDKEHLAVPHVKDDSRRIVKSPVYPYTREHAPSSCLTAPVGDIGRLADYAMDTMKKDEIEEYALVPDTGEHIGMGWFIREQNGRRLYGHEGADTGFRSSLWICPEEDIHIVLLANISGAPLKKMSKAIFDMLVKR